MGFNSPTGDQDINFNYNYFVIQTIMKMRDAKADDDKRKYWVNFEFAIKSVLFYLEPKVNAGIQQDFDKMDVAIKKIQKQIDVAEDTKNKYVWRIREDFADTHNHYILRALNKMGIVKVAEDGVAEFDSLDLDLTTKIVRESVTRGEAEQIMLQKVSKPGQKEELFFDPKTQKIVKRGTKEYSEVVERQIDASMKREHLPGGESKRTMDEYELRAANILEQDIPENLPNLELEAAIKEDLPKNISGFKNNPNEPAEQEEEIQSDAPADE